MVEKIGTLVKIAAAVSLQLLSLLLIIWVFRLDWGFSAGHIFLILATGLLVYLFVSFSLSLFYNVQFLKKAGKAESALDEDELLNLKDKNGSNL